jgi:hypothetical protein
VPVYTCSVKRSNLICPAWLPLTFVETSMYVSLPPSMNYMLASCPFDPPLTQADFFGSASICTGQILPIQDAPPQHQDRGQGKWHQDRRPQHGRHCASSRSTSCLCVVSLSLSSLLYGSLGKADILPRFSFFRPDPTKFFGIELGAQVKLDDKTERYIVSGAHDANRLRELLDTFIEKVRLLSFPCQSKPSG